MAIVVFQHSDQGRPGRLGLTLRDHAFNLEIYRPDKGEPIPVDLDNVDAVVSLGGSQSVGGPESWIAKEMDFIRAAHERSLPVVGLCLGCQIVAAALGGEVSQMESPEVGMLDVEILPPGQTDTMLAGVAWRMPQFQIHGDEVKTLPEGAVCLARSEKCDIQAFRAGMRTYGFQFHFECDQTGAASIVSADKDMLHQAGRTSKEVLEEIESRYEMFARLSDRISLNIATCLIPKVATMVG